MKLIKNLTGDESVNYLGKDISIPSWTKYLATTSQGVIIAFESFPELDPKEITWDIPDWGVQWCELYQVELEHINWKETLFEV